MLEDLRLPREADREVRPETRAQRADVYLCLPVAFVVGALGVDHQTTGARVNGRQRCLRFGHRLAAIREHPGADPQPLRAKPGHQRRRELQFGGDSVGSLDVQGAGTRLGG